MEFANNRNTGDPTSASSQLDCFNNLYYSTHRNDAIQKQENTTRVDKTKYMTFVKNNIDNQLPNSLYANGRPYQQEFKADPVIIRPMSYYENGRNLSLFKATDNKFVDVSGTMFRNSDLRVMPVATTRPANIQPVRDMKVATNEYIKSKTGMGIRIYPPKRKEIDNDQKKHISSVVQDANMMRYNIQKASPASSQTSSMIRSHYTLNPGSSAVSSQASTMYNRVFHSPSGDWAKV